MSASRRIQKELEDLNSETKDHQNMIFSVSPRSKENLFSWSGYIFGPAGTPYQGGIFNISIEFPSNYPFKPPVITFGTRIYHPNISKSGVICLDILKNQWSPALNIFKVLLSLSSLLSDPNPNDPLDPDVAHVYLSNKRQYEMNARVCTEKYAHL
jgi:ubiquitin-conjugating enzyme E2 D